MVGPEPAPLYSGRLGSGVEAWMPYLLFAAFIVVPLAELALLVKLGQWLGIWWTLALIVVTAFAGMAVLQRQGFQVMQRALDAVSAGRPPIGAVVDGAFLMLAGLMLIAPGLITDTVGLLLLVPWIRHRVAAWSVRRTLRAGKVQVEVFAERRRAAEASAAGGGHDATDPGVWKQRPGDEPDSSGPIIDGEFERLDERSVDPNRARRGNGDARPSGKV
jgi:UPF0716 protein FxsA